MLTATAVSLAVVRAQNQLKLPRKPRLKNQIKQLAAQQNPLPRKAKKVVPLQPDHIFFQSKQVLVPIRAGRSEQMMIMASP